MSPRSRRELLDLAAQQQVEGIDLTARIVSLTPGPSAKGKGEIPSPPAPLPQGERGDTLTPGPSAKGRGEESLTPGSSPTRGEGRKPSPLAPLPQGERGGSPHPWLLSHKGRGEEALTLDPSPPRGEGGKAHSQGRKGFAMDAEGASQAGFHRLASHHLSGFDLWSCLRPQPLPGLSAGCGID